MTATMPVVAQINLTLSPQDIAAFRADGAIVLRKVFGSEAIDAMRKMVSEIMADPGPLGADFAHGKGRFFAEHFARLHHAGLTALCGTPELASASAQLMGSEKVWLAWDHVFVKEPGTPGESHWHQDQPYAWVDGDLNVSFWIALDYVTKESGGVQFVRGSHRWGKTFQPKSFDPKRDYGGSDYEPMPDIEAHPELYDVLCWDMEPGDMLAFHLAVVHYAGGNSSPRSRRAISLRYAGDGAYYAVRKKGPKLPRDPGLQQGESIGKSDLFPQVWPLA
jgi:ectoine hydroxylase-related dioxygenase (phytanoyl-CoA dioxygenase family)